MVNITIVHPFDPLGNKIGGVQTYIKDFIRSSPAKFNINLIGAKSVTDVPLRQITEICLDGRKLNFLPLIDIKKENSVGKIPLGLSFFTALYKNRPQIDRITTDIYQFHRIESAFPFLRSNRKKMFFLHRNFIDLLNPKCEVKWKYFPRIYKFLEFKVLINSSKVILTNRAREVFYLKNIPTKKLTYIPQWIDTNKYLTKNGSYKNLPAEKKFIEDKSKKIIYWGRLSGQKDPFLMLKSFFLAHQRLKNLDLIIVGEGPLKKKMINWVDKKGVGSSIHFLGQKSHEEIVRLAKCCDLFFLTSAFETGPIAVLEALACGLPILSTDVGLVRDTVQNNKSGVIVEHRSPHLIADKLIELLENLDHYGPENCRDSVKKFEKNKVLEELYKLHEDVRSKDEKEN
jgi:glycosyltransferase involved in cell wall biosynthesis